MTGELWAWLIAGESGSAIIRNLGLVIAAVIALPLAVWRSVVADRQAKTATADKPVSASGKVAGRRKRYKHSRVRASMPDSIRCQRFNTASSCSGV